MAGGRASYSHSGTNHVTNIAYCVAGAVVLPGAALARYCHVLNVLEKGCRRQAKTDQASFSIQVNFNILFVKMLELGSEIIPKN